MEKRRLEFGKARDEQVEDRLQKNQESKLKRLDLDEKRLRIEQQRME